MGFEEKMKQAQEISYVKAVERSLAKVSHERHDKIRQRGFDILTAQSYVDQGEPPPPRTHPKPSLWAVRHSESVAASSHASAHVAAPSVTATPAPNFGTVSRPTTDAGSRPPRLQLDRLSTASSVASLSRGSVRSSGFASGH